MATNDGSLRQAMLPWLERAGLEIALASDAADTGHALATSRFDVLILDLAVPDDGIELLRSVRSTHDGMKVLALGAVTTDLPGTTLRQVTAFYGADATLLKPFGEGDLLAALARLLD
ncbi:MAG: response regulator [Magnetospirillum sp.]|nr:response regulator [Magnetospirillum sp.]